MNLDAARMTLIDTLRQIRDPEDTSGFLGLDPQAFERLVQAIEDRDPHWLVAVLRDPRFPLGARCEVAGFMRGSQANTLLRELLAGS